MTRLPPALSAQVWIDFDGTITQEDLLDELIVNFSVDDSWKKVEQLWQAGEIGSRECLRRQFDLLRINRADLELFLSRIGLDPGMIELIALLDRFNVPRAILSDGIDLFIEKTLKRHGLSLPIRSNTIERGELAMQLVCPLSKQDCVSAAAHCKCGSIREIGDKARQSIYIGDGRSDLCPARTVEFVFAKGALAKALEAEGRKFFRFSTLTDVNSALQKEWEKKR
jgi:2-hydroxy-3-keto-5-methylthiopentenyl-1-phosphate phosphatase